MKKIKIDTEYIKLNQLLKYAEVASSGGEARYLIEQGWVYVDGEKATQRGKKIYPNTRVRVEGSEIEKAEFIVI